MTEVQGSALENLLREERVFPPPAEFTAQANVTADAYQQATEDRLGFWEQAAHRLTWDTPWHQVLDWSNPPFAKWFVGGRLNVTVNCVDRHVQAGLGDRTAFIWEGEPGDTRTITYQQLQQHVSQAANTLTTLGIQPGDRVAIYMPMIPELPIAMLACARIGAIHTVIFGGFSADALAGRIQDTTAKLVITADGGYRRGQPTPLKPTVDTALTTCPSVEKVLVVRRTGQPVDWHPDRDLWWHDTVEHAPTTHTPQPFDSEHPLFILYTSGTTAKPKGILHTSGGYLTQAAWTHHAVFDLKPDTDIYWCTADIGWVTGHTYLVYGPLANAATSLIYEGTPDTPHRGRWWELIAKHKVTILYTAPTAIRTFAKWGDHHPAAHDLSSLRLLGSVGEPINPEAWIWYRHHIGRDRCPIVDTWWQTETGAIMISPLPGVTATKPGSAMTPLPGITADILDDNGNPVPPGGGGYLTITQPWPAMARTIWGDPQRFKDTYWTRFPGHYFPGDGAKRDTDGHYWLLGRVDDVMLVSGHNISTTEVESALVSHPAVAEAAVVGASDPITGQGIVAFTILRAGHTPSSDLITDLRGHVARTLGPIAKPRQILIVDELPKTRSGKIMRRLLRDIAENRTLGDTTTLQDSTVMTLIAEGLKNTPPEAD